MLVRSKPPKCVGLSERVSVEIRHALHNAVKTLAVEGNLFAKKWRFVVDQRLLVLFNLVKRSFLARNSNWL